MVSEVQAEQTRSQQVSMPDFPFTNRVLLDSTEKFLFLIFTNTVGAQILCAPNLDQTVETILNRKVQTFNQEQTRKNQCFWQKDSNQSAEELISAVYNNPKAQDETDALRKPPPKNVIPINFLC